MNIINKLKNNKFTKDEILRCLDSSNPIVLYEVITCIVKNNITDPIIVNKLIQLSELLSDEYKMLGYYKLGHVDMGALLKLGFDEEIVFKSDLDHFEKEMTIKFYRSNWEI